MVKCKSFLVSCASKISLRIRLFSSTFLTSVPPGAGEVVGQMVHTVQSEKDLFNPTLAEQFRTPVNTAIARVGLRPVDRILSDVVFACNAVLLRRYRCGDCRCLIDDSIPPAEGLRLPTPCFPEHKRAREFIARVREEGQIIYRGLVRPSRLLLSQSQNSLDIQSVFRYFYSRVLHGVKNSYSLSS